MLACLFRRTIDGPAFGRLDGALYISLGPGQPPSRLLAKGAVERCRLILFSRVAIAANLSRSPAASKTSTPAAASVNRVGARTVARRASHSARAGTTTPGPRTAADAARARCSTSPAQVADSLPRCHSNPAATSLSTARRASKSSAAAPIDLVAVTAVGAVTNRVPSDDSALKKEVGYVKKRWQQDEVGAETADGKQRPEEEVTIWEEAVHTSSTI